jgi:hypothetical protein
MACNPSLLPKDTTSLLHILQNAQVRQVHEAEIDDLFNVPPPMPAVAAQQQQQQVKRERPLMTSSVEDETKLVIKKIKEAPTKQIPTTTVNTEQQDQDQNQIDAWYAEWNAKGKAGQIGLVPAPARHLYPTTTTTSVLPENVRAFLLHFLNWQSKKKGHGPC